MSEECPFCTEYTIKYGSRVHEANYGRYKGLPQCAGCGAVLVNSEWIKECVTCGEKVEKLYGLFIPHNCKECQRKEVEADRRAGRVCLRCRRTYGECCC